MVRIYCQQNEINAAMQLAVESQDPTACYNLARTLEAMGNLREAIQYYSKSQRYHHAVRIAR